MEKMTEKEKEEAQGRQPICRNTSGMTNDRIKSNENTTSKLSQYGV